ncbi:hypothetical protein HZC31_03765 [Candidatus Woesearchaeota archaeon]|nr:hypothetical protein [Candidatus Woesearchaeota archaeon]
MRRTVPFPDKDMPRVPLSDKRPVVSLPLDALLPISRPSLEKILSNSRGKTIHLEPGSISLENPIVLQNLSDVVFQGSADEDNPTIIRYSGNGLQLRGCSNVVVAHLSLEGPHPYAIEATGIAVRSSPHVFVYRCDVSSFARALVEFAESIGIVTESRFSESAMIDCRSPYVRNKTSLAHLKTQKNMGYGICVNNGAHVRVTQSFFYHCKHAIASGNDKKQDYYTSYTLMNNVVEACGVLPDPDAPARYRYSAACVDTHEVHQGNFSIVGNRIMGKGNIIGINIRGGTGIVERNVIRDCAVGVQVGCAASHRELYHPGRVIVGKNEFVNVEKEVVFTKDYLSYFPR